MSAGDRWEIPGMHQGIETDGSTRDMLRLMMLKQDWPFPVGIREVPRVLCKRLPSRYLRETQDDMRDEPAARW